MSKLIYSIIFLNLLTSLSAFAQEKPTHAVIRRVDLIGSGCDASSAQAVISADLQDLSVLFSDYGVEIGNGSAEPNALRLQKDCEIKLQIEIPSGWSFGFKYVDYRGFSAIPAGAWGFHRFSFVTNLRQIAAMKEVTLQGPINQEYQMRAMQKPERIAFTPCGANLQEVSLISQIGVQYYPNRGNRELAMIVLDSADFSSRQNFGVQWKRCPPGRDNGHGGGRGNVREDDRGPQPGRPPIRGPIKPR